MAPPRRFGKARVPAGSGRRRAPELRRTRLTQRLRMINYYHSSRRIASMKRTGFTDMACPIARSLERVGEWWSILILRDAFHGLTQFDQFQQSLGIAPNMLTRRLNALVSNGLLERRRYSDRPPRNEYVLTEKSRDFRPVLWALLTWGNSHFAPEGPSVVVVDAETGITASPVLMDLVS